MGRVAERWETEGLTSWLGLCEEVSLHLLGGDEKQLLSPLLFPALSSSYLTLSFSKTLLFHPRPASPDSHEALQQLCLRLRSWQTTKWAVIGQLPALILKPPDPHLWFSACPFLSHSDLDFALNLLFILSSLPFSLSARLSICFWHQRFYLSVSSCCQPISSRSPF